MKMNTNTVVNAVLMGLAIWTVALTIILIIN